jgi:hypothetical protein
VMGSLWPRAARRAGLRLVRVWVDEPHGVAIVELHDPRSAAPKLKPLIDTFMHACFFFTQAFTRSPNHCKPITSRAAVLCAGISTRGQTRWGGISCWLPSSWPRVALGYVR